MTAGLALNAVVGLAAPAGASLAAEHVVGLRPSLASATRAAAFGGVGYFIGTELSQGNPRAKLSWGCMIVAFTANGAITAWQSHRFRPSTVLALAVVATGSYVILNVLLFLALAVLFFTLSAISGGGGGPF